ncbi:viral ankyrin 2 [Bracoviriform demolitoris]|uniref:I-Kappa-B like protein G2 n=1 Tax=Microplitis demolitor bracovirus (isolate Webb) TaxID=654919 RepID=IKBG2_MDBVW|nr:NF-kappa-B inhibitor cactus [Microplitis demolitor]YP_239380.1 viral ankyrin 2 [Bracoviriform demolitoris]XP_053592927.1 NF-kappa-B inhibitor cactus-like [Microplitis demolitor]Q5I148.1 RecName: Full=I-Kappa-B like protein G2 [Microplitis demolitor bracovirus (isolate Webb)]AAW51782.1 viral ankyrin 2 [Bracoviriform demolitoris]KAG6558506.1 viral ankyrin G4 [Microplitis demolitor]
MLAKSGFKIVLNGCLNDRGDNLAHYFSRQGDVIDLIALKEVINDDNRHLLLDYNFSQRQCVHIVVCEDKVNAIKKLKVLLEMGADINGQERKGGNTPLHLAVHSNNYKLVKWLCKQPSINKTALNYAQKTPHDIAIERIEKKINNALMEQKKWYKIMHPSGADLSEEE